MQIKLKNLKIGNRLNIGFGIMATLTLFTGLIIIIQMYILADLTEMMYHHPFVISNEVRDIKADIIAMHRSMKDVVLAENKEQIENTVIIINEYENEVYSSFEIVFKQFLGNPADVKAAYQAFSDWKSMRDEVILLMKNGKQEMAADITRRQEAAHVEYMSQKIQVMIDFAGAKGRNLFYEIRKKKLSTTFIFIVLLLVTVIIGIIVALVATKSITIPLNIILDRVKCIAKGDLEQEIDICSRYEIGELADSLRKLQNNLVHKAEIAGNIAYGNLSQKVDVMSDRDMVGISINQIVDNYKIVTGENKKQNWLKTGQNELNENMRGDLDRLTLTRNIISYLTEYLNARGGALYLTDEKHESLKLFAACESIENLGFESEIRFGEGLCGQAALAKKIMSGTAIQKNNAESDMETFLHGSRIVTPVVFEGTLSGIIELEFLQKVSDTKIEFLSMVSENIAINLNSAQSRSRMKVLLEKTRHQQEKLQITNQELAQKNRELESARKELEKKAGELEKSIRYKSEFMANMSHELRTPLNGMLILSKDLAANRKKNIHADQVELLEIIYKSGSELLELINDILDFSKIEAGKMTVNIESVRIEDIACSINPAFEYIAKDKGLDLKIHIHEGLPETIWTDPKKLDQIIKNLVGNAIKFTEQGSVSVDFYRPDTNKMDADLSDSSFDIQKVIAISVSDTGIGVVDDKHVEIFEPFQQADGSTSRKYEGTGLGLSISRSMASLLGGKIHLKSTEGQGAIFTLYLHDAKDSNSIGKIRKPDRNTQAVLQKSVPVKQKIWIEDDRKLITEKDRVILIIEDDLVFAGILARLCHERSFKFIHSIEGEKGLEYIEKYQPDAIMLDIQLPGITGWHVLDFLKDAPGSRHIPVLIISIEDRNINGLLKGAAGFLTKPVTRKQLEKSFSELEALITRNIKTVLIIQADNILEKKIEDIIIDQDVNIVSAKTGKDALQKIKSKSFDCVIAGIDLSDISVFAMLDKLNEDIGINLPPFIVYEGKEISLEDVNKLLEFSETIVIKYIKTEDGLLDATSLFLHRMTENLSKKNKAVIYRLHDKEKIFKEKKILIVDHNMRNLFAISKLLEDKGACVLKAANGKDGLCILDKDPDADIMLLDVSMPLIDGYEVLEKIRYSRELKKLPVIVMMEETVKNEKDRYILAGANDYLSKPVNMDRLMTLMAFWFEK